MLKIGDEVQVIVSNEYLHAIHSYAGKAEEGDTGKIIFNEGEFVGLDSDGKFYKDFDDNNLWLPKSTVKLVEKISARPHAELIRQWLDDLTLEIEYKEGDGAWNLVSYPTWRPFTEYRIKQASMEDLQKAIADSGISYDRVIKLIEHFTHLPKREE